MTEWTQQGYAVIADSNLGGPLVVSFRPGRSMAEADLLRNQIPKGMEGTVMEKVVSTLRIVEATLTFDDGKAESH